MECCYNLNPVNCILIRIGREACPVCWTIVFTNIAGDFVIMITIQVGAIKLMIRAFAPNDITIVTKGLVVIARTLIYFAATMRFFVINTITVFNTAIGRT